MAESRSGLDQPPDGAAREDDVFERCPSCGTIVVQLATHQCPSTAQRDGSTREERERMAERDDRDDQALVGVFQRASGSTYAYHELDGRQQPRCPTRNPTKAKKFEVMQRQEAKERGKAPCGHCRSLEGGGDD